MKRISLKSLRIENFKGIRSLDVTFADSTTICGQNASGKTSIFDAFTWLLFGKDSTGNEKFSIRPLDADGNKVHNVEISVEAVLDIDGTETTLKKTQKEKWVKKRGSENPELQGNDNLYEIDGYPKKETEYKAFVADLLDEKVFKAITNPMYFTGLPWKEQRDIITGMVNTLDNVSLAKDLGGYEEILDELAKAPSESDILTKYRKIRTELAKKQAELPVRIDEISKQKVDMDIAEVELNKKYIEEQIAALDAQIAAGSVGDAEIAKIDREISSLKDEAAAFSRDFNRQYSEEKKNLEFSVMSLRAACGKVADEFYDKESLLDRKTRQKADLEQEVKDLQERWKTEKGLEYDGQTICPYCGQELPHEHVEKMVSEFKAKQQNKLNRIVEDGKEASLRKKQVQAEIDAAIEALTALEIEKNKAADALREAEDKVKALVEPDIYGNEEYQAMLKAITEKETEKAALSTHDDKVDAAKQRKAEYREQLGEVNAAIASYNRNIEIDERISQLQQEQVDTAQKIADCEKVEFLTEKFIKDKMDSISRSVNDLFDNVQWVLFERLLNGSIVPCCEASFGGVRFKDLNSGHKIIVGMRIINTLVKYYGMSCPVWVDNAESINEYNVPSMDGQTVLLKVTDDKELTVK